MPRFAMKNVVLILLLVPAVCHGQSKKSPGLSLAELNTYVNSSGRTYQPADTVVFSDNTKHAIKRINKYELDDGHTIVVYARTTDNYYVPLDPQTASSQIVEVQMGTRPSAPMVVPTKEPMPTVTATEKAAAINSYKPKSYTAGNGVVYKVGELIGIGKGSLSNGDFMYLNKMGWSAATAGTNAEKFRAKRRMADYKLEIKGINEVVYKNSKKVILIVGGGNVDDYELDIEEAIDCCEVKSCDPIIAKSLAQLQKMKADGKISETEFQREKTQILKK